MKKIVGHKATLKISNSQNSNKSWAFSTLPVHLVSLSVREMVVMVVLMINV